MRGNDESETTTILVRIAPLAKELDNLPVGNVSVLLREILPVNTVANILTGGKW